MPRCRTDVEERAEIRDLKRERERVPQERDIWEKQRPPSRHETRGTVMGILASSRGSRGYARHSANRWRTRVTSSAREPTSSEIAFAKLQTLADQHLQLQHGLCSCCGHVGAYNIEPRALRETFQCASCQASLRYRNQADALLTAYGVDERSIAELVQSPAFRSLSIYEPGISGPFRPFFSPLPAYTPSYYWPDVDPGQTRDGVRCENLEALTFADASFDLVISSDIFEHVRRPFLAFREIHRILRPGGRHIFTVPMNWPFDPATIQRVDVSHAEDRNLLPAVYHGSPLDPAGSLVYNDFGMDLPFRLTSLGFQVLVEHGFRNVTTIVARRRPDDLGGDHPTR